MFNDTLQKIDLMIVKSQIAEGSISELAQAIRNVADDEAIRQLLIKDNYIIMRNCVTYRRQEQFILLSELLSQDNMEELFTLDSYSVSQQITQSHQDKLHQHCLKYSAFFNIAEHNYLSLNCAGYIGGAIRTYVEKQLTRLDEMKQDLYEKNSQLTFDIEQSQVENYFLTLRFLIQHGGYEQIDNIKNIMALPSINKVLHLGYIEGSVSMVGVKLSEIRGLHHQKLAENQLLKRAINANNNEVASLLQLVPSVIDIEENSRKKNIPTAVLNSLMVDRYPELSAFLSSAPDLSHLNHRYDAMYFFDSQQTVQIDLSMICVECNLVEHLKALPFRGTTWHKKIKSDNYQILRHAFIHQSLDSIKFLETFLSQRDIEEYISGNPNIIEMIVNHSRDDVAKHYSRYVKSNPFFLSFLDLAHCLYVGKNEILTIVALENFINTFSMTAVNYLESKGFSYLIFIGKKAVHHKISLLYFLASLNLPEAFNAYTAKIKELTDFNTLDISRGVFNSIYPKSPFLNTSPLMIACQKDHLDFVQVLLDYPQKLTTSSAQGHTCLFSVRSEKMLSLLQQKMTQETYLKLLLMKSRNGSIFDYMCNLRMVSFIDKFFAPEQIHEFTDIKQFLSAIIRNSFLLPKHYPMLHALWQALSIQHLGSIERPLVSVQQRQADLLVRHNSIPKLKQKAIVLALKEYRTLLSKPLDCLPYLQAMNAELHRYFIEKHQYPFPELEATTYDFKQVSYYNYPFPNKDYIGIKKHSALQGYLQAKLQQAGIAQSAMQWIGFVPKKVTVGYLAHGTFFTESRRGSGAYHTKLAHMLQLTILAFALESGAVPNVYMEGSEEKKLMLLELMEAMIKSKKMKGHVNQWTNILECTSESELDFTGPMAISTAIMRHKDEWHIGALGDHLIDTFCKGVRSYLESFNQQLSEQTVTMEAYAEKCKLLHNEIFYSSDWERNETLENKKLKHNEETGHNEIIQQGDRYAVVRKHYDNQFFKPKMWHELQSKVSVESPNSSCLTNLAMHGLP